MFINSINILRAISIIFIVSNHFCYLANLNFNSPFEKFFLSIIAGTTSLFVFISGFLFNYIYYEKYEYRNFIQGDHNYFWFIKRQIKNVLCPYLLISALPILYYTFIDKRRWHNGFFIPNSTGFINEYIIPAIKYYWTGAYFSAYWYIMFIMITFILSPFHILFIKTTLKIQLGILILFSIISLFIHRPIGNLGVFQSVFYFTPYYLLGIISSKNKNSLYNKLTSKELYLLIIVILLCILQIITGNEANYFKLPFTYGGIDIQFLQKVILCIFFFIYLHRFENYNNKYINYLAETSFAVFFLHCYFESLLNKIRNYFSIFYQESWMLYIFLVISIIILCVIISKIIKKLLPNYSRYLIGY